MKLNRTVENLVILALMLLAFFLRAYRLNFQSYWIDEAWTVHLAHLSLADLLDLLRTVEPHPPLYFPSIIYWVRLVSDNEFALRFYSLVFGVLAIPFTYRLGKELGRARLGLAAALLMTLAPFQIWYSQEARMYTLLATSATMSMWGFVSLCRRGGRGWWLVYIFGTWWLMLSHYHGLVVIGLQGLFLLLAWRRHWQRYPAWGSALLVVLLLYLPWLLFSWNMLSHRTSWTVQPTLWASIGRSAVAYSIGEIIPQPGPVLMTLLFVALYLLGLAYAARHSWGPWRGRDMLALLLAYTVSPILVTWLYGEWRTPVYLERYLIPVQTGYLLVVALGLLAVADGFALPKFRPGRMTYGLATGLLLGLAAIDGWVLYHYYFNPVYARPDWRAVVRTIETYQLPGDAVVLTGDGGEKVFNFYYKGDLPVYYPFNTPVPPEAEARRLIAAIAARHQRLWYIPYGVAIDGLLEQWLAEHTYPAWQSWLGRKRLALYAGSAARVNRLENVEQDFADPDWTGPVLLSAALPNRPVPAGDLLPLALTWQAPAGLDQNYQLSLRLVNQQGDIFVQSDWPPLAAAGATSTWPPGQPVVDRRSLWLSPDTPPGSYNLQVVVYDPATGQAPDRPVLIPGTVSVDPAQIVVPLAALPILDPIQQPLGDLLLVGYAMPDRLQPGEEIWLWLYWLARQTPDPDTNLSLGLVPAGDEAGQPLLALTAPLAASTGPLASWQPGQVRRAVYHLPTSPQLETDLARLRVTISVGKQPAGETTMGQITLELRPRQFELPAITYTTDYNVGRPSLFKLVGYELPRAEAVPGETLPVTLYYQVQADIRTSYSVFVQLLNAQAQVVAQVDSIPLAGAAPTTTWYPGEILTDPYTLVLPADLPGGNYRLIAGFYNPATGERLPVSNGQDFVELHQVTVK